MFWQNEEYSMGLGRDIRLDGVVCVVDAVFGKQVRAPRDPEATILTVRLSKWKKIIQRTALERAFGAVTSLFVACESLLTTKQSNRMRGRGVT